MIKRTPIIYLVTFFVQNRSRVAQPTIAMQQNLLDCQGQGKQWDTNQHVCYLF